MAPKDELFIFLSVLKAATKWDSMGKIFEKKGPTLQRLLSHAVGILSPILYQDCVKYCYSNCQWHFLSKRGPIQILYLCSLCHWCHLPSRESSGRNLAWRKTLLKWQTQIAWLKNWSVCDPTRQTINFTDHKPGSISVMVIFVGTTFMAAKSPENWVIFIDMGYQGAQQQVQEIIP